MPRFLRLVLASTVLLSACADPPAKTWTPLRRPSETAPSASGKAGDDGDAPGAPAAIPPALPKRAGVVFVHGTGDAGKTADLACSGAGDAFKCVVPGPVADYWTPENIDSQRRRGDGSLRPYAVVGCPLGSQTPWTNPSPVKNRSGASPEPGSADCVAAQARRFLDGPDGKPGTDDDITDVAIVTHSGGSNVVRYILAQRTKSADFARLHAAARRVVALAPPTRGTYLANYMFREGSLGSTLNGLIGLFGGAGFYDDDGVAFIQTNQMDASNRDPARFVEVSADPAGVPMYVASGAAATTSLFVSATRCAGSLEADALAVLHTTFLSADDPATYRNACSDGFITCTSAMATAAGGARVIFGRTDDGKRIGKATYRNHNQSRRTCDGVDVDARSAIDGAGLPTVAGGFAAGGSGEFAGGAIAPIALARAADHRGDEPALASEVALGASAPSPRRIASRGGRLEVKAGEVLELRGLDGGAHVIVHPTGDEPRRAWAEGGELRVDGGGRGATVEIVEPGRALALAAEVLTPTAFAGEEASFAVAVEGAAGAPAVVTGAAVSPSGRRAALRAERGPRDTWTLHVSLGPDAEPGAWSARLDARGDDDEGRPFVRTVDVAFTVAIPTARLDGVRASLPDRGPASLRATVESASRGHLGVRAVLACSGGARFESQSSAVFERGRTPVELRFRRGCPPGEGAAIVDVALVSHDQAATLHYLPSAAP